MEARLYKFKEDYKLLTKWWKQHEWPGIPEQALPPLGIVIEDEHKPICAGFVYQSLGTPLGWLEWVVADRDAEKEAKGKALDFLIETLKEQATQVGTTTLFTSNMNKNLEKRYLKHGFNVTERNMTNLLWSKK